MLADASKHALFLHDALQLLRRLVIEHHVRQAILGVGDTQKTCQLTARPSQRYQLVLLLIGHCMRLGRIDHVAQLHRQLAVAHLGFVGGHLHGDRVELSIVPVDVRLQERLELFCAAMVSACVFWLGLVAQRRQCRLSEGAREPLVGAHVCRRPRHDDTQQPIGVWVPTPWSEGGGSRCCFQHGKVRHGATRLLRDIGLGYLELRAAQPNCMANVHRQGLHQGLAQARRSS